MINERQHHLVFLSVTATSSTRPLIVRDLTRRLDSPDLVGQGATIYRVAPDGRVRNRPAIYPKAGIPPGKSGASGGETDGSSDVGSHREAQEGSPPQVTRSLFFKAPGHQVTFFHEKIKTTQVTGRFFKLSRSRGRPQNGPRSQVAKNPSWASHRLQNRASWNSFISRMSQESGGCRRSIADVHTMLKSA